MKSFLNKEVKRCKCVYYKDLIARNKHKPAHIISPSLTQLYNLSFVSDKFMAIWKSAWQSYCCF